MKSRAAVERMPVEVHEMATRLLQLARSLDRPLTVRRAVHMLGANSLVVMHARELLRARGLVTGPRSTTLTTMIRLTEDGREEAE